MSSCSHDNTVKLWNVGYLFEGGEEGEDKEVGASFKAAGVDAPAGPPATTYVLGLFPMRFHCGCFSRWFRFVTDKCVDSVLDRNQFVM